MAKKEIVADLLYVGKGLAGTAFSSYILPFPLLSTLLYFEFIMGRGEIALTHFYALHALFFTQLKT